VIRRLAVFTAIVATVLEVATIAAEPRIQLRVPQFAGANFANFSNVVLPATGLTAIEIVIEDALAEIQAPTVRITLNETPMTPFVSINPLPTGVKAVIRLGLSLSPEYSLKREGENILVLTAADRSGVTYRAQFYLTLDASQPTPQLAKAARTKLPASAVQAPIEKDPPRVVITSSWPARTADRFVNLSGEVTDVEGIRRIIIEVNGKDVEEIVLQNERPVRKQNGFIPRTKLPGEVSGDGQRIRIAIPVRIERDKINVIAVRAENTAGLRTRADKSVEGMK